ncbi:UNVERIFIED_CONTAM: hypothetical protein Sradi_3233600 [Sesamum radiatum]|uniref:DUF4218 domain-containing protein n=1 Tax=Sesamum radiatum TaxID=300843 RepID=A0AAW2RGW0_SESRA
MDVKGKTKDNVKARLDLQDICKRRNLELKEMNGKYLKPKASYTLSKDERAIVLKWIKDLRLPDGYASNLGRSVNLDDFSMYGMKSHDCHVFMEKLLPIAFRDLLPESVWNALTELSLFFRDLCSTVLLESNVKTLEENIIVTLCKLEKIFPPSFFDSMEHLPIHLAYEARCGGPIQYRWMYPFERRYDAEKYAELPDLTPKALGVMRDKEFASWFFNYVENPTNGVTETDIRLFSRGFSSIVKRWNGYFVNGYRFHTLEYGETNSTMNSGVCISGSYYDDASIDYYGELTEILELSFLGPADSTVVMFKCRWFDVGKQGMKFHPRYKIVDINYNRSMAEDNPFVLASQCHQVCYTPYPWRKKASDRAWRAIFKVKARSTYEMSNTPVHYEQTPSQEFYQETSTIVPARVVLDNELDDVTILTDAHRQEEEVNHEELQPLERELEHEVEFDVLEEVPEQEQEQDEEEDESEDEDDTTFDDSAFED